MDKTVPVNALAKFSSTPGYSLVCLVDSNSTFRAHDDSRAATRGITRLVVRQHAEARALHVAAHGNSQEESPQEVITQKPCFAQKDNFTEEGRRAKDWDAQIHAQVRHRREQEGRPRDARNEARRALLGPLQEEGEEPQTSDRDWALGSAALRRQGSAAPLEITPFELVIASPHRAVCQGASRPTRRELSIAAGVAGVSAPRHNATRADCWMTERSGLALGPDDANLERSPGFRPYYLLCRVALGLCRDVR
jgi:hypothetical protein